MKAYETAEGQLVRTQAEAGKGFATVVIPDRQQDLIDFINRRVSERAEVTERLPAPPIAAPAPTLAEPESYVSKSVRFDEEFSAMPLAQQLHFAAMAMENARERIE
jgi:hypothetical protein